MQEAIKSEPFGVILKRALDEAKLSNNAFANAVGISEGSVRKLLKVGLENNLSRPEPEVLAAVCKILPIPFAEAMWSVYKIDLYEGYTQYSLEALTIAKLYDLLPPQQQETIRNMVNTIARQWELAPIDRQIARIAEAAAELKQQHELFAKRRPQRFAKATWFLTRLAPNANYQAMVNLLLAALEFLFSETERALIPTNEGELVQLLNHPDNVLLLNHLIADSSLRSSLERIYWLFFIWTDTHKLVNEFTPAQHAALRDLWRLIYQLGKKAGQDK